MGKKVRHRNGAAYLFCCNSFHFCAGCGMIGRVEVVMRFAYLMDPEVTYYRRVLSALAQFARARDDLDMHVEFVRSSGTFHALDQAGYDGLILGTAMEG